LGPGPGFDESHHAVSFDGESWSWVSGPPCTYAKFCKDLNQKKCQNFLLFFFIEANVNANKILAKN